MDARQDDALESGAEDRLGDHLRPGSCGRGPGGSGRDGDRDQRDREAGQRAEGVRPVQEERGRPGGRGGHRPLQRELEEAVPAQPGGFQNLQELPFADRWRYLDSG